MYCVTIWRPWCNKIAKKSCPIPLLTRTVQLTVNYLKPHAVFQHSLNTSTGQDSAFTAWRHCIQGWQWPLNGPKTTTKYFSFEIISLFLCSNKHVLFIALKFRLFTHHDWLHQLTSIWICWVQTWTSNVAHTQFMTLSL